jgi:hypothetical protein
MTPNVAIVHVSNPSWCGLRLWIPLFLLWIPVVLLSPLLLLILLVLRLALGIRSGVRSASTGRFYVVCREPKFRFGRRKTESSSGYSREPYEDGAKANSSASELSAIIHHFLHCLTTQPEEFNERKSPSNPKYACRQQDHRRRG